MSRTLVIGDIHGFLEPLQEVLKKAAYNSGQDRLICLGDYVDSGPNSFEVAEFLLQLDTHSPQENIFLLGNHDAMFLEILQNGRDYFRAEDKFKTQNEDWYSMIGKETYHSYLKRSDQEIMRHQIHFFKKLLLFHLENNRLFVHAGFNPDWGFEKTLSIQKKELIWNRSLFQLALEQRLLNPSAASAQIDRFDQIFIGHTPTPRFGMEQPRILGNVINLDQGVKMGGFLTAWDLDTGKFWQSSRVPDRRAFPE